MKRTITVQKAKLSDHRGNMIKLLVREKGQRAVVISFNESNYDNSDILEILKQRKHAFLSAYEHARKKRIKKILSAKLHMFLVHTHENHEIGYDGGSKEWYRKKYPLLRFYDFEITELPRTSNRDRQTFSITYGDV